MLIGCGQDDIIARFVLVARAGEYRFRNLTHEERLLNRLFLHYDPVARPTMDTSKTVTVQVDFLLLRIHGLVSAIQ